MHGTSIINNRGNFPFKKQIELATITVQMAIVIDMD